jgi:RNA polymerase sigma-70 factor (ECF subfamily)
MTSCRKYLRAHTWPGTSCMTGGIFRPGSIASRPPDSGGIPEVGEREHIQETLARMPHDYAVALVLSAAQGISYQEIAVIVGISPNAAATRISRAKRIFAELYQRIGEEEAGVQEQKR